MLWIAGALALILTWGFIMPVYFGKEAVFSHAAILSIKIIPTTMAALFALTAFLKSGGADRYALLICIGLFVCAVADYQLGVRFVVGGALFFAGHMLYLAALGSFRRPTWWSLPVFLLAVIGLWFFCHRYFDQFPSKLLFLGVLVYCMALGALLGFSLPLPFLSFSRRAVLAALGAALFVLSDMGTCHVILGHASRQFDFMSLGVYYTAQLLLGMSAFL